MVDIPQRPALTADLSPSELRRWYWLQDELVELARQIGVSTSGGKRALTERLCASLDGSAPPAPAPRRRSGTQLSVQSTGGPLTGATVIPAGQRSSQALREFFVAEIGSGFRFDAHMRRFIEQGEGRTLAEAVDHWHATRSTGPAPIAEQFELNRFTRRWYEENPRGRRSDLLEAWRAYRSAPMDGRDGVACDRPTLVS